MLNLEILSSQKVKPDESPHYSEVTGDRDDHEAGVEAQQQVVDGLRHGLTKEQGESDLQQTSLGFLGPGFTQFAMKYRVGDR